MKTITVTTKLGRNEKQVLIPAFNIAKVEANSMGGSTIHLKTYPSHASGKKGTVGYGANQRPIDVVNDLIDVENKIQMARG